MAHPTVSVLAAVTMLAATAAAAAPLELELTNGTARDLEEIHVAVAGSGAFGADLLGESFLPANNTASLPLADDANGCAYDLRFVFADGAPIEAAGLDLCSLGSHTITE